MPCAHCSRALALLLAWTSVIATVLVLFMAPAAASTERGFAPAAVADVASSAIVSPTSDDPDVLPTESGQTPGLTSKLGESLQERAMNPQKGSVDVMITTTDVPALRKVLSATGSHPVAHPWGAVGRPTTVQATLPEAMLVEIASRDFVAFVDDREVALTTHVEGPDIEEARSALRSMIRRVQAGEAKEPNRLTGQDGGFSPTSWSVAAGHRAVDVWRMGYEGNGVNIAIVDTGLDFGTPALNNSWAVAPLGSPWEGWPIAFHPASMEALFGVYPATGWTAASDLERLPLPFWSPVNDGDSWYTNTDYRVNDTDLDGWINYKGGELDPVSLAPQYTPQVNPQGHGCPADTNLIDRQYWVGAPGDPNQIVSASGLYRLGVHRDDTLTGIYCEKVGLLLVDSATPGLYDTVYVDLDFDFDFTNDKAVTKASPLSVADVTGDGVPDISGGLLYFIAESSSITGEVVIAAIAGTETNATLANGNVAVDIEPPQLNFIPATQLWLVDTLGFPYYVPGTTEAILEEYTGLPVDDTGIQWDLDGPRTTFGPVNAITGRAVQVATLLRGTPDFAVDFVYSLVSAANGVLVEGVDYTIDLEAGTVSLLTDFPAGDPVTIIYQLATYTLEPVSGTLTFWDTLPAGWSLEADYQTGLPIPYSQVYGPTYGYDTFIPANGDLIAMFGDFDEGQYQGTWVASSITANPFGNLVSPSLEVFGSAPEAKVIGIAACCNVPGPLNFLGDLLAMQTFAALGYDGLPGTRDEASAISNSWGSSSPLNTGFSFTDRWFLDFWSAYPETTPLVAGGNVGPGYGSISAPGSSPGVITVGAGTSSEWRILAGLDGGTGWGELPLCPPPPIDPALCVGGGNPLGPYGDMASFSSRGPTLLGQPKPDIVSIGDAGLEAIPLNRNIYAFGRVDGNTATDFFSGTSMATPVTAGVIALMVEAYRATHGNADPTNDMVKTALKSGADDMQLDILQQGAGWTNALRSVEIMAELDGIEASPDHWVPGGYQGVSRPAFVNLLPAGTSDSTTITLRNHHPAMVKTVTINDDVFVSALNPPLRYSFSLGTGTDQHIVLKPDGVYLGDGSTRDRNFDFLPQWNTADFMKVTFTYDAVTYTAATTLSMQVFDWTDADANGQYGGTAERNRISSFPGQTANYNSVWYGVKTPGARVHDGLALNLRSGATAALPATIVVEFYQRSGDWSWVSTSLSGPQSILAGDTLPFTVTATPPAGTPPGLYEGAVYIDDGVALTTIPIVVNVPVSAFPVTLGGDAPTTSLYDNNGFVQGNVDRTFRVHGDNRYVWADVNALGATVPNLGQWIIYNAILDQPKSDPEMFLFRLAADPSWPDPVIYGPGTMNLVRSTPETFGVTSSAFSSKEIMFHAPPLTGFYAFQVKAWSAWGGLSTDPAIERAEANIGIFEVFPTSVSITTNQFIGSRAVSVWSNVPIYDGIDTVSGSITTATTNLPGQTVLQDVQTDVYTASYVQTYMLTSTVEFTASIDGLPGHNYDLYLFRDTNDDGVFGPPDPFVAVSGGVTADETLTYAFPPDGRYFLVVHGYTVPGGLGTFSAAVSIRTFAITPSPFSDRNAPTETVPAYTPTGFDIEWRYPETLAEGAQPGGLLIVSPAYAPLSLIQQVAISLIYDVTAPTMNPALDLSPVPNSVINNPVAPVAANVADPRTVDRFSPQLFVDGVDASAEMRVFPGGEVPTQFNILIVTWEHATQPWDDGRHSAVLHIRDVAGNLRTQVWSWTVDTTGPRIAITNPAADAVTTALTWPFEAETEPGAAVTVTVEYVAAVVTVSPGGRITGTLNLREGANEIRVTATDALGNEATATRSVVRDNTAPAITATTDVLSPTNSGSATVTGTVNEGITVVRVEGVAAAVAADGSFTALVPLVEGANVIDIVAWDAAGNQGTASLPTIIRDTVAPTISVDLFVGTSPAPAVITDISVSEVTVSGNVPDADAFFVTVNGQPVGVGGTFSRDFVLAIGDNVFVVEAVDDAGNVATATVSVSYSPVVVQERSNYNSIIASGVAVVLLILGFVVGYLLSGRGGGPETPTTEAAAPPEQTPRPEEELPPREEAPQIEEEEV